MTVEIFKDIPMDEYRKWDARSQSEIKKAETSIEHYEMPFESKRCFDVGTAFHSEVLTPNDNSYIKAPEINKSTNLGRAQWKAFQKTWSDRAIITPKEYENMQRMLESVRSEPRAKALIEAFTAVEVSAIGDIEKVSFKCKGRIDAEINDIAIDLKSAADSSPAAFSKSIYNYGYDFQAFDYSTLFSKDQFVFIVTQSVEPWITEVYYIGEETMQMGRDRFYRACKTIEDYEKTGFKGGYTRSHEPVEINAPGWAFFKEKELNE